MKIKFFTILIILISNIGYSQFDYPQELSFNKKLVSAIYKDQNGNQKQSKISTLDGNFKFSIIKAAEQKNSPIIQIFGDNEQKVQGGDCLRRLSRSATISPQLRSLP